MWSPYDEDLFQNKFFKEIKLHHEDILKKAAEENWIICVPRNGSLKSEDCVIDVVLDHILVKQNDITFVTLSKKEIGLENHHLKLEQNTIFRSVVKVLFEETHYVEDTEKYTVWCIEKPLFILDKSCDIPNNNNVMLVTIQDCIDFLYSETSGHKILENIQILCGEFWKTQEDIFEIESLQCQRDFIGNLYSQCLQLFYKCDFIREKCERSEELLDNFKIAVETYMQYCLGRRLMSSLNTIKHLNDSFLNKIIRNSVHISSKDLNISDSFNDLILNAGYEIRRINNFVTVLDKLNCLAKTFKVFNKHTIISDQKVYLTSDDFLQILVYLILKSNIPNWVANLTFLKEFNFATTENSDQNSFLVASLEAAIEFIKSTEFLDISQSGDRFIDDKKEDTLFYNLYTKLKADKNKLILDVFRDDIVSSFSKKIEICHPLCSCQNCVHQTTQKSDNKFYKILNKSNQNFLIMASIENDVDLLDFLLSLEFEINFKDSFGKTALHYAAERGFQDILLLLVNKQADVNVLDNNKNTPLHLACDRGHDNCVKALIYSSSYVEVNLQNISGETPLFLATRWGYFEIIKILLENGASVCVKNYRKMTVYKLSPNFHISKLFQQFGSIKSNIILEEVVKNTKKSSSNNMHGVADDNNCNTDNKINYSHKNQSMLYGCKPRSSLESKQINLMLKTVENNDLPLTCFYLGYISTSVETDSLEKNCHPLCTCKQCLNNKSFSSLDDNNANNAFDDIKSNNNKFKFNVNACNEEGYTALHVAAKFGRTEILRILLDSGAFLNVRTRDTLYTPLHLAVMFQRIQTVKELLKCGDCQVDAQDYKGNTPLYYACVKINNHKIVEILIKNRADCQVKNNENKSILQECEEKNLFRVCRMLRESLGYSFPKINSEFSEYAFSDISLGSYEVL